MEAAKIHLPQSVPEEALAPGSELLSGQYEITRYLSSGGFGITYQAKDSLGRPVVIKECFPEALCGRVNKSVRAHSQKHVDEFHEIVRLFINEAHALSRAEHPSVVGVHQVFEDNETAYMSLDLVDGKDLLDVIQSGAPQMTPAALKAMTIKLLDAIGHVHSLDLLHRDISPDNILLDKTGRPVLIDFGAAREEASRKTRALSSVLVVKDGYSPPEFYVAGSKQMPSSDLYAFAATLVHVITGSAPADSQSRMAAMAADQLDPYEPLAGRFPAYEDAFLEAIDTAMEIAPHKRLQSASEWIDRIDETRRTERALRQAEADGSIDEKITRLLAWAHDEAVATQALFEPRPDSDDRSIYATETNSALGSENNVVLLEGANRTVPPALEELDEEYSIEALTALSDPSAEETVAAVTPYERVKTRALEREAQRCEEQMATPPRRLIRDNLNRLATVPVVFCSFFFYAQTAFEHDRVHAVTIQPLVSLGAIVSGEIVGARETKRSPVVVRRGSDS